MDLPYRGKHCLNGYTMVLLQVLEVVLQVGELLEGLVECRVDWRIRLGIEIDDARKARTWAQVPSVHAIEAKDVPSRIRQLDRRAGDVDRKHVFHVVEVVVELARADVTLWQDDVPVPAPVVVADEAVHIAVVHVAEVAHELAPMRVHLEVLVPRTRGNAMLELACADEGALQCDALLAQDPCLAHLVRCTRRKCCLAVLLVLLLSKAVRLLDLLHYTTLVIINVRLSDGAEKEGNESCHLMEFAIGRMGYNKVVFV